METVKLVDICRPKQWKTISTNEFSEAGYPVYGANGKIGFYNEYTHEFPTVLITCRGATCGTINISEPKSYVNGNAMALDRLNENYSLKYLYYVLKARGLNDVISGSAQPQITREGLSKVIIPNPPLETQKHIAQILDAAAALCYKTKQLLKEYDALAQSIFYDMFGGFKSKDWNIVKIENIVKSEKGSMRTGPFGSDLLHSEFVESGISVLGIDNAVLNTFQWKQRRYITEEKYEKLKRYTIYPKDIIITIMGTVGRVAVVPDNIGKAINTKHLAAISLNEELANPEFVAFSLHSDQKILQQINQRGKGAIMKGLNLTIIKDLKFKLPPIILQNQFAEKISLIEQQKQLAKQELKESEDLFNCLLQKAFKGELV